VLVVAVALAATQLFGLPATAVFAVIAAGNVLGCFALAALFRAAFR